MKKGTLKNIAFGITTIAALTFSQYAKGQQIIPPQGEINMYQTLYPTEASEAFESLRDPKQINDTIESKIKGDWTYTIPGNKNPTWNCNQWSLQLIVNSQNFGENVYYWDKPLFNNYKDFELNKIYANSGTLIDMGKLGLPLCYIGIDDSISNIHHGMCAVPRGDDLTKLENWNLIEPRDGITNVQPGELNIPLNCERLGISYAYLFKNDNQEQNLQLQTVLEFKIENGISHLIYNINDDPRFNGTGTDNDNNCHLITKYDANAPILNLDDKLNYEIKDDNFKNAYYTLNGENKTEITTKTGTLRPDTLNIPDGTYNLQLYATDHFKNTSETSKNINISHTGINDIITNKPAVYPNPFRDNITIKNNNQETEQITIYDIAGRMIYNTTKQSEEINLQNQTLETLTPGIYLIQIGDQTQKIIK